MSFVTPRCPKLRSDLLVGQPEAGASGACVIKEPATQRFFRFRAPEMYVAQRLDGVTPLDVIRRGAEEKFEASLSPETLDRFVDRLRGLGLLEADGTAPQVSPPRRGLVRGNILYLRFKLFDPDRLFECLSGAVHVFFTPSFVALTVALVVLALGVTVANWTELGRTLPQLYRPETFVLAWLVLLTVITLHEFAHGLACKHFGGRVRELGLMLIFFQPAMYCNVSDAWLFPEKSRRLWVTFAGAFFELFIWALATLLWRLVDPGTTLGSLALVVMITSGIKTIFNLNPLIKLDGYYLLSDYLEVPNLNQRSFAYLGASVRRWFGGNASDPALDVPAREARILTVYGLLAGGFCFVLLGWVALRFGAFLVARYQGVGFVLAAALWIVMFRQPLRRTVGRPFGWLASARGGRLAKRLAKIGAILAIPLIGLYFGSMELKVSAGFTIMPTRKADIRPEVDGVIAEVFVSEGAVVRAGQPIARLSDLGYRPELEKIEAELAAAGARLRMQQAGPTREEIDLGRSEHETAKAKLQHASERYEEAERIQAAALARGHAAVEKAAEQLKNARHNLQWISALVERGAGSQKELVDARSLVVVREKELDETEADLRALLASDLAELREAVVLAQKELEEASDRLAVLLAGFRPELIEETEAQIARLAAQRRYLEKQIGLLTVTSPIAGVVTTPKVEERIGELVEKGELIACVHALDRVTAEIAVPEKEIADVRIGQRVVAKARAYPQESFFGEVVGIASSAISQEEWSTGKAIIVKAELDNSAMRLKPEMTGHAKIHCGRRRAFDVLMRRVVRYLRVEFWSWW